MLGGPLKRSGFPPPSGSVTPPRCGLFLRRRSQEVPGIPLDLFEQDRQDRPEIRVDVASGVPATGTGTTVAPMQPFVFSQSIAPMLGIEMPSTGSGSYSEMTISASLTAAAKNKATAQESTAAVLTPATATPRSIRGRLTLNLEDIAAIGQANFESALRQNAQAVVSDALDTQIITGNARRRTSTV